MSRAVESAAERTSGGAVATSRRERRKREVRQRIFEAGIGLFVEQGVQQTTLDEIAERADVARATVYNHFGKKGDILAEWGARNRERVRESFGNVEFSSKSLRDQLIASFAVLIEAYERDRRVARMIFGWASAEFLGETSALAMIFADLVRRAQESGQARQDVDAMQVGQVLRASYLDTVFRWSAAEQAPFDLKDALRQVVDIVVNPIAGATPPSS
jgi:AcrR family transcriptional regulator